MRRPSTFEVILHVFVRLFHLEERNVGDLLATLPCLEPSTSLFLWNIVLGEQINPIFCGMFLLHEGTCDII
jgi:hypothetical protein